MKNEPEVATEEVANRKSGPEVSDIIKQEEEDLKRALVESLKDIPGPSSAVNSWEIPPEMQPEVQPEVTPEVKPEIIEIKDEGRKCFSIFGSSRTGTKSGSTGAKRGLGNPGGRGKSLRGSKTRGIKGRGRGKVNSRGSLRGQTTLKRLRIDDAETERKTKLKVKTNHQISTHTIDEIALGPQKSLEVPNLE